MIVMNGGGGAWMVVSGGGGAWKMVSGGGGGVAWVVVDCCKGGEVGSGGRRCRKRSVGRSGGLERGEGRGEGWVLDYPPKSLNFHTVPSFVSD